jgi:hypothetical protein
MLLFPLGFHIFGYFGGRGGEGLYFLPPAKERSCLALFALDPSRALGLHERPRLRGPTVKGKGPCMAPNELSFLPSVWAILCMHKSHSASTSELVTSYIKPGASFLSHKLERKSSKSGAGVRTVPVYSNSPLSSLRFRAGLPPPRDYGSWPFGLR